jgi:hypothetical protein
MSTLFENYFNASEDSLDYLRAVSENWLTMLVARAYRPGCKADNMLILEGKQGIGKSRALRVLGGDYYRESKVHDLGGKDFIINMLGSWIYDINELRALKRADHTTIKALLSSEEDTFRLPYGHKDSTFKRTCVIVGTTNESEYLIDSTGARRFWPVKCGYKVEVEMLERDREQILAEAVVRFKSGADWWTMPAALADEVTDARGVISPFFGACKKAVDDVLSLPRLSVENLSAAGAGVIYAYVTADYIYSYMQMDNLAKTSQRSSQIAHALRNLGFESARVRGRQLGGGDPADSSKVNVYRRILGSAAAFSLEPDPPKVKSKLS